MILFCDFLRMILVFCMSSNVGKMVLLLLLLFLMLWFLCVSNLLMFLMLLFIPLPPKKGSLFMVFTQGNQLLSLMIDSWIKYLKPSFPNINIVQMQYATIYHGGLSMSTIHFGMFSTTCGICLTIINYFVHSKIGFPLAPKVSNIYFNYCRQDCACNSNNTSTWFKDDLRLDMAPCQTLL